MASEGSDQLARVGLALKVAGATGLKLALSRELKALAKPLVDDVKKAAAAELPKKGGLGAWVADSKFTTSVRFTGAQGGMRIYRTGQFNPGDSSFRHPVFPRGDDRKKWKWVNQPINLDWFYTTLESKAPEIEPRLVAAMDATAALIARGV